MFLALRGLCYMASVLFVKVKHLSNIKCVYFNYDSNVSLKFNSFDPLWYEWPD